MANQAKITSLEALDSFRSRVIVFQAKARRALNDVGGEVDRTRQWLQHDQRAHWEHQLRQRRRKLEQAEQELLTARLGGHREAILARQAVVRAGQEALSQAEEKLRAIKQWSQRFDSSVFSLYKSLDDLRQYLDNDIPQAVATLANIQKTLEAYTDIPSASAAPSAPPETQSGGEEASPVEI